MNYLKLRESGFKYGFFKKENVSKVAYSPLSNIWFLFDERSRVIKYYPDIYFFADEPITALKGEFVIKRADIKEALEDIAEDFFII